MGAARRIARGLSAELSLGGLLGLIIPPGSRIAPWPIRGNPSASRGQSLRGPAPCGTVSGEGREMISVDREHCEAARVAAKEAGRILMEGFGRRPQVYYKGRINLVTDADRRSEAAIVDFL